MGNCCGGTAKCASASSPLASKVPTPRSGGLGTADMGSEPVKRGDASAAAKIHSLPSDMSSSKTFSLVELKAATKNFDANLYLGEGGFGCVYKGWLDEVTFAPAKPGTGKIVAIKKLKRESFQGHREWLAEVTYLGELRHENLVKLVGYCSESDDKLLVYEYMPRGSLENHLFRRGAQPIPWARRVDIATDVARGLLHLHNLEIPVIFRDLKSSNVLLDSDFKAKLSDFGLARNGPTGDKSHISTRVFGTQGYAAPEYLARGHLSVKSDMYSFGVVLLELLTGKRAMDEDRGAAAKSLVEWARPFMGERRKLLRIMDTKLGGQYVKKEAMAIAAIAQECLQSDPRNRPTAAEILPRLEQLRLSKDAPSPVSSPFSSRE